jgi:REP-associated tyrosine transposase
MSLRSWRATSAKYIVARRSTKTSGTTTTMVRYRRNFLPGGTYFFTVTLSDRRSTALVDHVSELRDAFRVARRERPLTVEAIVILPDHLHAIFTLPLDDADFSGRWRRIKGHFSSSLIDAGIELKRNANGSLALWQKRFWEHTIRNENDFARHVDYIHFNPVKHGLVSRVCDWPYSSFHRYVRQKVLTQDWAGDAREGRADFGERPDQ